MKNLSLTFATLALLSISSIAGQPVVEPSKAVVPPTPEEFYRANEFNVGLSALLGVRTGSDFGHRTWSNSTRPGVDLEPKYFCTRNLGFGLEGEYLDINRPLWGAALNIYGRFPLGESSRWAPYIFGGAGGLFALDQGRFEGHVGAGIECRFTPKIGMFADGRYVFVDGNHDNIPEFALFRLGLNFVF